jgi:hypothetical protein
VSGRHSKPIFHRLHPADLKSIGGVIAGAALAGAIAASAAVTTPNTDPATASDVASKRTLADIAVLRADDRLVSRHEAHRRHVAHVKHKARVAARSDEAKESRSEKSSKREPARVKRVSAQQVINLAKDQVGISEDRSGQTKFNKWYADDSRALGTIKRDGGSRAAYREAAWCDMFVSWVGDKLGVSGTMGVEAWTVKHAQWFKDRGRFGKRPRPGAVTFFGWSGSKINDIEHVGFTIKDNRDGTIQTVEGNTNDTVAIRKRGKSSVVGYGYPDYRK